MNINACSLSLNPEFDASNNFELSGIYGDVGDVQSAKSFALTLIS